MPYHTLVITSGISLFGQPNYFGSLTRERGLFAFERTNPITLAGQDEDVALTNWLRVLGPDLEQSALHPERISAEYSLVYALARMGQLAARPQITLLHTATLGGQAAACLLELILSRDFDAQVKLVKIDELDVSDRMRLRRALSNFMHKLAQALEQNHPSGTCFAPIGGYKVMTSYGYLAAAIHGYSSAYLHEDSQILHQIPPLPFRWPQLEPAYHLLFRRLMHEGVIQLSSLTNPEKIYVNENPAFFDKHEDELCLNALGDYLFSHPQHGISSLLWLFSKNALKQCLQLPHAHDFLVQQMQVLQSKVLQNLSNSSAHVGELYHEATFGSLDSPAYFHLYKGASNGELVFRACWRYQPETFSLELNGIWVDHNRYEREVRQLLSHQPVQFEPWVRH